MTDPDIDAKAENIVDGLCTPVSRSTWMPIATAPKDGTKIDLLYPYPRGRTIDCQWRQGDVYGDGGWFWSKPTWEAGILLNEEQWSTGCYPNMQPTHWMPLPAPPIIKGDQ